ncbi:MAG: uracil-DNA glycosylase, partial [Candidatus Thioglobus sp.]|nr:uracil-DNA glycosylase [Candidatus Thioglobus sp.]
NEKKQNLVFLLWGAYAQKKTELIDQDKHLVLTAAHPSPFSAHKGFFGCKHFSKTNDYLKIHKLKTTNW